MSQRGTRPRSWCPRGDSPLRVPETANLPSPVATPGLQGLPPAVASPRSTPTPFKLRRLSMGTERSGSPCAAPPSAATVLPALHMAAAQLEQQQQQQRQAAQQAAQQNTAHTDQNMTPLFKSPTPQQQQQQQQQEQQQQQQQSQQQYRNMTPTPQDGRPQSGVFYPMPQHPASPTPLQQNKRPFRHSPILLRDSSVEPRSPPSSRPGSVVFRERDIWSPPSSRPSSAMSREKDLRSPPPAFKPTPFLHSERDFRSPTPSRPFPFRQKERDGRSPFSPCPHPLTQRQRSSVSPGSSAPRARPTSLHLPGIREPWSPTRPSPLAQRDRDPLSPPMGRPSPLTYERDLFSPPASRPASLILNNKSSGTPLSMFSFPGPDGDLQPSTQDLIDRQSQDFVDERLAEFQAQIHQLQGEYSFGLLRRDDGGREEEQVYSVGLYTSKREAYRRESIVIV
ncbi:transcription factor SPT20 homolog isoform X1 [Scylla paramamosain]|uniref:transcription factor SPT20 homolog isoform X1 n=1 Tax=Scylla paramamosain TaxID=85552 RepID=UPI003082B313